MRSEFDPDISRVSRLAHASPPRAQHSVDEAAGQRSLFRHLAGAHRAGGRSGYVEIDAPLELYALARILTPRHVVEVGASSGVSSAYLLAALPRNHRGTLHSMDLPQRPRSRSGRPPSVSWSLPPGRSSGWAVPMSLRGRWDLRRGDKAEVLPLLAEELPSVGLFLYDVPHDDAKTGKEFAEIDRRLPRGAVVIVDHGPSGGECPALRRWATQRNSSPIGRAGLGLYGFRAA